MLLKWEVKCTDGSTENWYRQVVKAARCGINVPELKIKDVMKNESGRALSRSREEKTPLPIRRVRKNLGLCAVDNFKISSELDSASLLDRHTCLKAVAAISATAN